MMKSDHEHAAPDAEAHHAVMVLAGAEIDHAVPLGYAYLRSPSGRS
jgi:hypothetical protein